MDYRDIIASKIKVEGFESEQLKNFILIPPDKKLGDFSFPSFRICKAFKMSPVLTAQHLKDTIDFGADFEKIEAVNGYLNFYVNRKVFFNDTIVDVLSNDNYGASDAGSGKTVCIDYSSINIAKPFHMGHLSTTAIGAALYRIYKHLGYNAVGINHLGDWGTQFGKLISAYKKWSSKEEILSGKIKEMLRIYVKFHEEAEKDPSLNEEARMYFKKIEDGDAEAMEIFTLFKEMTLTEVDRVYKRLNVNFDSYAGESFYNDKMQPVLEELKEKDLSKISEGATVVDLEPYGMPPCLLVKADGATLYATRDMAAAFYRKATYNFHKCLYVVAYQQNLHFKQFFKVIEIMGHEWAKDLEHIAFGMVSLEGGAMSTRKGNLLLLEDVLDKCAEKAYDIISAKNPDLKNLDEVAEIVGTGAVVFSALVNSRIKDIVFSYDRVLNFDGETGPYLQYSCVRAQSVLNKADKQTQYTDISFNDFEDIEFELAKSIAEFKETLFDVIDKNEPSYLTRKLIDIAKNFNKFYYDCKINVSDAGVQNRRLCLTQCTQKVLKTGLGLLGIKVPDSM